MAHSPTPDSLPISAGGYAYHPERDKETFEGFTAAQLRRMERRYGFNFSRHPAMSADSEEVELD